MFIIMMMSLYKNDVCSKIIFFNVRLPNPSWVWILTIFCSWEAYLQKKKCNKRNKTCLFMLTVPSQLSHYFNDYCYSNYQWVQLEKLLWRLLEVKNRSYLNMNRSYEMTALGDYIIFEILKGLKRQFYVKIFKSISLTIDFWLPH